MVVDQIRFEQQDGENSYHLEKILKGISSNISKSPFCINASVSSLFLSDFAQHHSNEQKEKIQAYTQISVCTNIAICKLNIPTTPKAAVKMFPNALLA